MTAPTWDILVPTISQRAPLFLRLMDRLLPQLDAHGGRVRVVAWRNDGDPHLGQLRDNMISDSKADYVSFVDDDDLVSEDYVGRVVAALESRPDHVGFRLEYRVNGVHEQYVDHSLKWGYWHRDKGTGMLVRDFTHIDPIVREKAETAHFSLAKRGRAEDRIWCRQLRGGLITEEYVDAVLYTYLYSPEASSWVPGVELVPTGAPAPRIDHPHFSWHPRSDC